MKNKNILFLLAAMLFTIGIFSSCDNGKSEPSGPISIVARPLSIDASSGEYFLSVDVRNGSYSRLKASSETDWITNIKVVDGGVSFQADENRGDTRLGSIYLDIAEADDLQTEIAVTQSFYDFPEFAVNISSINSYGCTVNITPRSYKGNYYFLIMNKSAVDQYLALDSHHLGEMGFGENLYQADIQWLRSEASSMGMSLEDHLSRTGSLYKITSTGEATEMPYSTLSYNSDYYLVVYGLSLSGERTTPIVLRSFTTKDIEKVDLDFTLRTGNITAYTAEVFVTPSTNDYSYYWTYISEMDYAKAGNDKFSVMQNMISNLRTTVSLYGGQLEDWIHKGPSSEQVEQLWAGTKYTVIAWGMDSKGSPTTDPVEIGTFTTKAQTITDNCTFQISVTDIKDSDIRIKVVPSKNDTRYYIAAVDVDLTANYTDEQFAQRIINMESERFKDNFYTDPADNNWATTSSLMTGTQEKWARQDLYWTFKPDHKYIIYVFGVAADGTRSTAVARSEATTEKAKASDMTFEVAFDKIAWNSVTYTITPSKNDEYYLPFLIQTSEIDDNGYRKPDGTLDDEALMKAIDDYYEDMGENINYSTRRGKATLTDRVMSNSTFSLLVCGFSGANTTRFYEYKFNSPDIPLGKGKADVTASFELFNGEDLYQLDNNRWKDYRESCVIYMKAKPTDNAKHWYVGFWQPYSHYIDDGGIDYIVRLIQSVDLGNNFIDRTYSTSTPDWYGCYVKGTEWTDEEGTVIHNYPWCFYAMAEDEDANYSQLHRTYFVPVKSAAEVKEKYDVAPSKAYDFWSGAQSSSVQVFAMDKNNPGKLTQIKLK